MRRVYPKRAVYEQGFSVHLLKMPRLGCNLRFAYSFFAYCLFFFQNTSDIYLIICNETQLRLLKFFLLIEIFLFAINHTLTSFIPMKQITFLLPDTLLFFRQKIILSTTFPNT